MKNNETLYYSDFVNFKEATPNSIYVESKTLVDQYTTGQAFDFNFKVHHVDINLTDTVLNRSEYDVLLNNVVIKEEFKFEAKGKYELTVKYKELTSEPIQISVVNPGNPYLYMGILFVCILAVSLVTIFIKKKKSGM